MEIYNEFAHIYDTLMEDVDYGKWYDYIKRIFENNNISPKNILEIACGTGNFTKFLCKDGYNVTCFDISEDMLSVAYDKLKDYKNVTILKQDMIDFNINIRYDAILSICDSINYITDLKNLKNSFENVYSHLKDGGIFIFDINSYHKLSKILGDNTYVDEQNDIFYVWENFFDDTNKICEFYLNFFIKKGNNKYKRIQETHIQKAYTVEEIVSTLNQVGFNTIEVYESFTFKPPRKSSERINFIAKK
ncbi:class I SAM-dependent DNA methyltransferase [Thermohalobacter berrensis]|uniref:Methyltransferase n=1 Tax=Thermohalobacter berrensis TaxID=99594 RepID=A0A419T4M1_9FIRM|nr:class I SAM-dependent methyltransferase [Thermohalobacter berrensis]RKD32431.1 methyltransferase [Thermohalobacter berrensis]